MIACIYDPSPQDDAGSKPAEAYPVVIYSR